MLPSNLFFLAGFLFVLGQCNRPTPPAEPKLLAYFQSETAADTLHFEISQGDTIQKGDTIPNPVFFRELPAPFLQEIDYIADSAQAQVIGRQRYRVNDSIDLCLVDINEFWFKHRSLLVYNRRQQAITGRVTVAEWYGGDGGQILTGAWMFDFDADGDKDLVLREIEHSTRPDGEEVIEETRASAWVMQWDKDRFQEMTNADTTGLVARFPIRSMW